MRHGADGIPGRFSAVLAALALWPMQALAEPVVGIVTFTVDNSSSEFFQKHIPEFTKRDIPGTLFGVVGNIDTAPEYMTWKDVRDLQANGWEFASHGYSHVMLSQTSDDALELELGVSAALTYRATGVYPTSFASPFGDHDERVLDRARVYYDAHFLGWGKEGINLLDQTDHFRIHRKQVANTKSVPEICAEMERAGREGHWKIYIWHWITDTPTGEYDNATGQFLGVLDCADRLRDQGIIRLMTARDALQVVPDTPRSPD